MSRELKSFKAEVVEVFSGDDLILMVDLGVDSLFKRVRARLRGVDTPSAFKTSGTTNAGKIREEVKSIVHGKKCHIELHAEGKGGWLVTLHVPTDESTINLNDHLRAQGYVYQSPSEEHTYG